MASFWSLRNEGMVAGVMVFPSVQHSRVSNFHNWTLDLIHSDHWHLVRPKLFVPSNSLWQSSLNWEVCFWLQTFFFHLIVMETIVLFGLLCYRFSFCSLLQICTLSCLSGLQTVPLTSRLGFHSNVFNQESGPDTDRCGRFLTVVNEFV